MLAQQAVCMSLLAPVPNVISSDHAVTEYVQNAVSNLCDTVAQCVCALWMTACSLCMMQDKDQDAPRDSVW